MRYEMRIAGSGGQGIIMAGIILAEAGIFKGYHVIQSQNYGPEARGGASVSEVIVSDAEIDYPKALGLNVLLAFNQRACDGNLRDMKPQGLVIVDADSVNSVLWVNVVRVPFSRLSRSKFKDQKFTNMLAVGVLAPFCPWFSTYSIHEAIARRMPQGTVQANLVAFREGVRLGRDLKKRITFHEIEGPVEV